MKILKTLSYSSIHTGTHVYVCVYECVYVYVCVYAYFTNMYVWMYVYLNICRQIYIYIQHVCMCVYININIYIQQAPAHSASIGLDFIFFVSCSRLYYQQCGKLGMGGCARGCVAATAIGGGCARRCVDPRHAQSQAQSSSRGLDCFAFLSTAAIPVHKDGSCLSVNIFLSVSLTHPLIQSKWYIERERCRHRSRREGNEGA